VLDVCEGLSIEAVIEAAQGKLKPTGSSGKYYWLSGSVERHNISPLMQAVWMRLDALCQAFG